ncbi:MAG: hypothetical protein L6V79_05425 [Clostridium sp.]|nr:MAG: hypothetical protein L6V79_05425 [Clostridium sp.]
MKITAFLSASAARAAAKKGINKFQSLLNLDDEHKEGIIRISVSETNTIEECDFFLEKN